MRNYGEKEFREDLKELYKQLLHGRNRDMGPASSWNGYFFVADTGASRHIVVVTATTSCAHQYLRRGESPTQPKDF